MAASTGKEMRVTRSDGMLAAVSSLVSSWVEVITDAINGQDNSGTMTVPQTIIDAAPATSFIFERKDGLGTSAQLRASVNMGVTVSTNPVFQVFGRSKDSANAWQKLLNQNGSADLTCKFTGSGSDPITEGGRIRTTPDADSSFDMAGCDEFFVARKTALAVSAGTVTASGVEAKVL